MKLKRVLSMVLCLCMVLSWLPKINVFAEAAADQYSLTIEAEDTTYAVWNLFSKEDTGAGSNYSGGTGVGGVPGVAVYPSFDAADTEEDLAGGFIDKSNNPYIAFYVNAQQSGTYYLSTGSYFACTQATEGLYAAFLVNPSLIKEDAAVAYKGYYSNPDSIWSKAYLTTEEVAVELVKGMNVIYVIPLTAEQNVSWTNVDFLKVTGSSQVTAVAPNVQTLNAAKAPYIGGYTNYDNDSITGSIGGGNWGDYYQTAIADMNLSNAADLRGFTYTVNAPEDGYYDITAAYESAAAGADAYAVGLLVDGNAQAREFAFKEASNAKKGYVDFSVYLTKGDHVLTFTAPAKRTADDSVGNNVVWFNYNELYLYGGLTQSVIQANPAMEWWYAESELTDYTVWNNYTKTQTNHTSTVRDFTGTQYIADIYTANSSGKYQGTYVGYGSCTANYTLAQLQEGRLDETTAGGVTIYVEAPADGTYEFKANIRMNNTNLWDSTAGAWTSNPVSVFMVNGEFGAAAEFTGKQDWVSETKVASLELKKGLNEIVYLPLTADHCDSAAWANIDLIYVDTALQVVKIPTGSVTYTPEQGIANLYTQMDTDGTIGYDKRTAANYYNVKASTLTKDMLHTVPFMAYTVEAPYDGYYNISLAYKSKAVTAQNYAIAVLIDEGTNSEVKHIVTDTTGTADVSTYLTAGTHTVAFTLAMPISADHEGTIVWCNLGNITMEGGLVLAEEQVNPLYYGMSVLEAENDAYINRHDSSTMKQAQTYASGGYDIGSAYSSSQTVDDVKQHLDPTIQPYAEYIVEAEEAGEYTLMVGVRGKFSVGYKLLLQVNGTVYEQECHFDDNVNCHQPITVSLEKGRNVVRVLGATSDIGWVNQDCLGLPAGLTGHVNSDAVIQQSDRAVNMGNYNYVSDNGKFWDSDGLDNVINSGVSLSELSEESFLETSWYSVTVEAPGDGWYAVAAKVWIPAVETAQLGKIGVLANGVAYEAKLWQDSSSAGTAEAFVYLNEGINDLIVTGILADSNVAADSNNIYWMDADYMILSGGLTVAETQRYPVQGLILGSAYTEENGVISGVAAGTTVDQLKSNFYGEVTVTGTEVTDGIVVSYATGESYTVDVDDAQTVKSIGASQIMALGNPVGRVLNYRNAVFMESSASGFTVSGDLEGDVKISVRAEEGRSNGGVACLYAEIDGVVSEFAFNVGTTQELTIASGLTAGEHTIKITKGTEAKYDMIYVYSLSYSGTLTQASAADMGIEFIGDSITVGYGLYEEDVTQNNAMSGSYYSYANVAADILGADHYTIGNGGWRFGANTNSSDGNKNNYLGYIYEKNSMNLNLGAYDFAWQPDVIVINLGTNDANQYTFTGTETDQEVWSADMAELLTMVRKNNPNAKIYWVYGAMEDVTANATKDVVVPLIQNAIEAYNTASGDDVTYVHVTNDNSGVYNHPTRDGHVVIGEEVAAAISGTYTTRLEAEADSVYWRYTAVETGIGSGSAVGGVQPGTDANMQSYADLVGGADLKKTEHPMMSFIVDVEAEGDYTLDVAYRAGMKTGAVSDYFMVVGVDDAAYTKTSYVSAHPENSAWNLGQATVHLTQGRHVIRMITMLADTRSDTLYTNWINIDYVDVTGVQKVTAVDPNWTHLQAGDAEIYNNFATPNDTSLSDYGDWYASVLGGYRGDSTGAGLTVENFTIYELAKLGYFSYTVNVPADGFYDLQTYIRCYNDYAHYRTGHILLAVDDQVHWFPAEYGYSVLKWNAQNLSVYLTKGAHTLTVSGIVGDVGTCAKDWCDMGALSVSGGITIADTQVDPLTLIQKLDDVYVATTGSDLNAGTEEAPVATLETAMKRVTDGGTIHIVDSVTGAKGLPTFDGTVTVTGGTLDLSAHDTVWMNGGIVLDDVTVKFKTNGTDDNGAYTGAALVANGHPLTVKENVTIENYIFLYGGGKAQNVASAELNIYTGDYLAIYGGGYNGNVTGTVKLNVGGDVNTGFGESMVLNHDGPNYIDILGGSYNGTVGATEVTFGGNAIVRMIFAGGDQSGANVDETNIYVDGGKAAAVYGGGRNSSTVGTTNVTMAGGVIEQVYGGAEKGTVTGDVNAWILGGEITRRLGGGSYNGDITGTVSLYLGEGLNYSRTYTKLGIPVSEDITARCRTGSTGTANLYFTTAAAYDKLYGNTNELADDPADNFPPERSVFTVYEGDQFVIGYDSLEEAMAACGTAQYIKLTESASVDVTLTKDLYIDLNGCSLTGTMTAGDYKVYGMDTTTDAYGETSGTFNCGVVPVNHFKTELTGAIRRYMAVEGENGYSFNRFYMGITHTSLKPGVTGVGYKSILGGSDTVKSNIASFGYSLQLDGCNAITRTKDGTEFVSGRYISLLLKNYDVEGYGETKLIAKVIITLNDGTVIESAEYTLTLKDMVETINASVDSYTAEQILAVQEMLSGYELDWDIANILNYS